MTFNVHTRIIDLGTVASGTNLPTLGLAYSEWYDMENVLDIKLFGQAEKNYSVYVYHEVEPNVSDWGTTLANNFGATGTNWAPIHVAHPYNVFGKRCKFAIQNADAGVSAYAKLKIHLIMKTGDDNNA